MDINDHPLSITLLNGIYEEMQDGERTDLSNITREDLRFLMKALEFYCNQGENYEHLSRQIVELRNTIPKMLLELRKDILDQIMQQNHPFQYHPYTSTTALPQQWTSSSTPIRKEQIGAWKGGSI